MTHRTRGLARMTEKRLSRKTIWEQFQLHRLLLSWIFRSQSNLFKHNLKGCRMFSISVIPRCGPPKVLPWPTGWETPLYCKVTQENILNICEVSVIWRSIRVLQNVIFKLFYSSDPKSDFYLAILKCFNFALLCLTLLVCFHKNKLKSAVKCSTQDMHDG